MNREFSSFEEWKTVANLVGWVHTHDEVIVCDDPDTDACVGEFDSSTGLGWIEEKV